ncbi:MAG: energy-coupling factor transporter transmembrane component T [Nitriliruptorales bacterium]|nr:energy-coupling factor transporter transmembrane component T [Nitriliruptorales bacterium]
MSASTIRLGALPRNVHPVAWWIWALGLATAATWTTNPLLLLLILATAGVVVAARRTDSPWGRSFRVYLALGAVVVAIRIVFRVLLAGGGDTTVFGLPELSLPSWLTGVTVGGPVTLEALLAGLYDGLRLGTMLVCVGAANALANPKRLLRAVPGALYEMGTVLVVAASMGPQLAQSSERVRRARRLRGVPTEGLAGLRSLVVPVLEDAFERSLRLAAAMDSRGYGRRQAVAARHRRTTAALVVAGVLGISIGAYVLLDPTGTGDIGVPVLAVGVLSGVAGLWSGGRYVETTRYRPDPWTWPEWAVVLAGVTAAVGVVASGRLQPGSLAPSVAPPTWPELPVLAAVAVLIAVVPALVTPAPPSAPRAAAIPEVAA